MAGFINTYSDAETVANQMASDWSESDIVEFINLLADRVGDPNIFAASAADEETEINSNSAALFTALSAAAKL